MNICILTLAGYEELIKSTAMQDNNFLIHNILKTKLVDDINLEDDNKMVSSFKYVFYCEGGIVVFGDDDKTDLFVEQISKYIATVYLRYVTANFKYEIKDINNVDNKNWFIGFNFFNKPIYRKAIPAVLNGKIIRRDNKELQLSNIDEISNKIFVEEKRKMAVISGLYCDDIIKNELSNDYVIKNNNEILWSFYGCEASDHSLTNLRQNAIVRKEDFLVPANNLLKYYGKANETSWCQYYEDLINSLNAGIDLYVEKKCKT